MYQLHKILNVDKEDDIFITLWKNESLSKLKNAKDIIDGIYDLTDDYNIGTYGKFIAAKAQFKRIVKVANHLKANSSSGDDIL
jgi:replicative DNA helicase